MGEFVIPCDFIILDMDESPHVPIIFGGPFLATARAEIDVQVGTISFRICGERVDFCLRQPTPPPLPATPSPPTVHVHTIPPDDILRIEVFYEMEDLTYGL